MSIVILKKTPLATMVHYFICCPDRSVLAYLYIKPVRVLKDRCIQEADTNLLLLMCKWTSSCQIITDSVIAGIACVHGILIHVLGNSRNIMSPSSSESPYKHVHKGTYTNSRLWQVPMRANNGQHSFTLKLSSPEFSVDDNARDIYYVVIITTRSTTRIFNSLLLLYFLKMQ